MQRSLLLLLLMGLCCVITCQLYKYHFITHKKTWDDAQQYCRNKYTDLATVSNTTDVKRLLEKSRKGVDEAWIGLHSPGGNKMWHWSLPGIEFIDKEEKWASNEPNDHNGDENCGRMKNTKDWVDAPCRKEHYFICYNESNPDKKTHIIEQRKPWYEAQSYCRERHTDLVSGLEQLNQLQGSELNSETQYWIGLFRDTWRWSDGSSFSFRPSNLPFDSKQGDDCAVIMLDGGGRWKSHKCDAKKPFFCYEDKVILVEEKKTWEEALYYCRDYHRDLVTITNLDEQRWVQEKAKTALTPFVWLGVRYTCTLDFWFWVSDEVVGYKNWASDGTSDSCDMSGAMDREGRHKWFKKQATEEFHFICDV